MKYFYKTPLSILTCLLIILFGTKSYAQYPGMRAFRAQQTMQMANQQQMQMQMMNINWRRTAGTGDKYTVVFKDSSIKKFVSLMYTDTVLHKNFLVYVNKSFPKSDTLHRNQKIYSDQTKSISTDDHDVWGAIQNGTPNDSCWSFKVISGPLTVYARTAGYLLPSGAYSNDFDLSVITGLQLGNGPIEKYSEENLEKMVGQNKDALNYIKKKKYYKAVKRYNRDAEKTAKK